MRIVTVNNTVSEYVSEIKDVLNEIILDKPLKYIEIRYSIDDSSESLGKKIKRAVALKIPAIIVIGPKDMEAKTISIRLKDSETTIKFKELEKFIKDLK